MKTLLILFMINCFSIQVENINHVNYMANKSLKGVANNSGTLKSPIVIDEDNSVYDLDGNYLFNLEY